MKRDSNDLALERYADLLLGYSLLAEGSELPILLSSIGRWLN